MSDEIENDTIIINEEKSLKNISQQKRRVHFPTDESQLRMISIAPEPLANQPLSSLGVIIQRYRAACQRLQIRPLNCLLEQLNTIDDKRKSFFDRLDCLKVVNERLDLKHLDAIEEILSRCRFYLLDFDSSFTDDTTLTQFFDIIEYYESCTHLNLSNNRSINFQGYQALTRYLRKTRYLERLDMNYIRFDDTSMLGFGRSIRMSSTLYELHMESCQLSGKILQKFIQNIRSCSCLRELYLCDNRLQVQDSVLINELIRSCGQFLHLLDLRSNSLQDNGMSHIASQLSQYDEHHTHQNSIYKISFQSNQLTHQGIGFLAKALLHNRTIRSLNLSHNQITNEGLFLLRDALLTNRTINELILRNCRLTDQAAIALAEFIAESSVIQSIDLRENNIQASGICGMAIAMKNNKSLLKLEFDPINSTLNSQLNNNIDRTTTTHTNSLLSLSNLRKMTVGFGGFASNSSNNSNEGNINNTRELLEQKAKWMNDIECICQRNLLLYEDQLRRQEEELKIDNNDKAIVNGNDQEEQSTITTNGIILEENLTNVIPSENDLPVDSTTKTDDSIIITQNNSEDTSVSTNENPQPTDISMNDVNTAEQSIVTNQDNEQSLDNLVNNNDNLIEQSIDTSTNEDKNQDEQITANNDEILSNGDNQEELQTSIIEPTLSNSPSLSDLTEDNFTNDNDQKLQIHHSDSLYLLRKKANNEDNNTSDDESQISSIIETQQPITDGV
ncbi:unnamed protein product [Adineta steineri]|uniref:Uncharacterized protein n=1 Tax=Adineta steineri TaxID=433720 RepID=A0A814EB10_9BILA|nr:unnamed protein product [Adineta steineri]CAF1404828.1 unnamed protein product [Adineta steineri]